MLIDLPYRSNLLSPNNSHNGLGFSPNTPSLNRSYAEQVGLSYRKNQHNKQPKLTDLNSLSVNIICKDEVVSIVLDEKASMDRILRDLKIALHHSPEEVKRKCVRLHIGSRYPEKIAIRNISRLVKNQRQLTLVGVYCTKDAMRKFASREHRLCFDFDESSVQITESQPEASVVSHPEPQVQPTSPKIIYKTFRSGTVLREERSIIIYGDVNAGAIVESGGNITVFGAIRGSVHAGLQSLDPAYIMAVTLQPTQLKIGVLRANPEVLQSIPRRWSPAIAHPSKGKIIVEDFRRSSIRQKLENK